MAMQTRQVLLASFFNRKKRSVLPKGLLEDISHGLFSKKHAQKNYRRQLEDEHDRGRNGQLP
jgi:hypothetical protein